MEFFLLALYLEIGFFHVDTNLLILGTKLVDLYGESEAHPEIGAKTYRPWFFVVIHIWLFFWQHGGNMLKIKRFPYCGLGINSCWGHREIKSACFSRGFFSNQFDKEFFSKNLRHIFSVCLFSNRALYNSRCWENGIWCLEWTFHHWNVGLNLTLDLYIHLHFERQGHLFLAMLYTGVDLAGLILMSDINLEIGAKVYDSQKA